MTNKPTYEELEQRVKELEEKPLENKQTWEALRESEKRYSTLSEASFEGILIHEKGTILDANSRFAGMYGYKLDELIGKDALELIPAEHSDTVRNYINSGYEGPYQVLGLRKDSSTFHTEIRVRHMTYYGRKVRVAVVRDITERKQAEEALRESEERFRDLVGMLPEAVFETNRNLELTYANQRALELFGYSAEDLKGGLNGLELIAPEDRDRAKANVAMRLKGEDPGIAEYQALRKDGSSFPILFHASSIIKEGELFGFRGILLDITERKQTEEALLESEERYRALFQYNPVETVVVDNEAKITMYNFAKEKAVGRLPNIGDVMYKEYAGKHQINMFEELVECIRSGDQKEFLDLKYEKRFLNIRISPFSGGAIITSTDITERKKFEDQFRQSLKMQAVGTLAGGIAHDFNNIMTIIIGNAHLALMTADKDDPLRKLIEEIKEAGERAVKLTRQLLEFSRKQMIQPRILDLNEVLTNLKKMLISLIEEHIEIKTIYDPALRPVKMDLGQTEQIIVNLTTNARDAMPQGGTLTLETANVDIDKDFLSNHAVEEQPGSYVMFSVTDTGTGMDEKTLEHIFEPFFTTKEVDKGTGLGLSTVYGIVKQNSGLIFVDSEVGKGSTIKVYLPMVEDDQESDQM